jgi:hypothetical protein
MIEQTTTTSFRVQLLQGVHNFDTDTFKIALYTGAADLGAPTTVYSSTNEVVGTGYTSGGATLTVSVTPTSGSSAQGIPTAYISFSNVSWPSATFTSRGALIYNASKSDKSVAVLNFGADKTVSNATFTVQFPAAGADSAIVRIS